MGSLRRAGEVDGMRGPAGEDDGMVAMQGKLKVCEVDRRKLMVARGAEEVGSLRQAVGVDGMRG